ncbi:hypothetical protein L195_g064664, partial [Trifolium pratense]
MKDELEKLKNVKAENDVIKEKLGLNFTVGLIVDDKREKLVKMLENELGDE